jgi:hypothetical protein
VSLSSQLLAALRGAGLGVSQHTTAPHPDEWFAGGVGPDGRAYGDVGPFPSAADALVGGVAWLVRLEKRAANELDETASALIAACDEVEALKRVIAALRDELRAEREAKG